MVNPCSKRRSILGKENSMDAIKVRRCIHRSITYLRDARKELKHSIIIQDNWAALHKVQTLRQYGKIRAISLFAVTVDM